MRKLLLIKCFDKITIMPELYFSEVLLCQYSNLSFPFFRKKTKLPYTITCMGTRTRETDKLMNLYLKCKEFIFKCLVILIFSNKALNFSFGFWRRTSTSRRRTRWGRTAASLQFNPRRRELRPSTTRIKRYVILNLGIYCVFFYYKILYFIEDFQINKTHQCVY